MIKENDMTLAEHLAALNAEKLAWVAEDPDNRWTGLWIEDLSHWHEMDIFTVAQFKRYDLETLFWEMFKDATGFRPRHIDIKSMSDEELQQEVDYLGEQISRRIEADKEWEADMIAYAQEDAEEENAKRDELPLPIDYVACHYQDGWL
jgi:hypothetical protein